MIVGGVAWLLIFLFDPETKEFVTKIEDKAESMQTCLATKKAYDALTVKYSKIVHKTLCVSDAHHAGRSIDEGVPLEIDYDTDTSFQIAKSTTRVNKVK